MAFNTSRALLACVATLGSIGPTIVCECDNGVASYSSATFATDHAIKQQLLGAVDDMFVNVLSNTHVGYANVATLQLLAHLYITYANIIEG